MKIDDVIKSLPDSEDELLDRYDLVAKKRYELSKEINELSKNLGEKFSDVLRQRSKEYKPLDDDIIDESSANDHLIDQYYEQSSIMIAIENKLRQITKEN
jgi:hypothetical protein